jgi:Fe2+ transport system protein FeoA
MKLVDLKEGEKAKVLSLYGGSNFVCKIKNMGITDQCFVEILKNDGKGPLIIKQDGSKIIIGRMMASKIEVEKI